MWFTRVSLKNPVFATMVMLAFVVLGLFSLPAPERRPVPQHRLPGGGGADRTIPAPRPRSSRARSRKKVEEAVNSDRRHQRPDLAHLRRPVGRHHRVPAVRRRPQGRRRRAREGRRDPPAPARRGQGAARARASTRPTAPIWSLAVLPDAATARSDDRVELTNWADQVLQEAAGERARRRLGDAGGRHQARDQHLPATRRRWRRSASAPTRSSTAVRNENQDLPLGAIRSLRAGARGADRCAHAAARRTSADIIVARKGRQRRGMPVELWQVADVADGRAGNRQPGALQRPAHAAAAGAEGAGREHHRGGRRPEQDARRDAGAAAAGRAAGADHRRLAADPRRRWRTCGAR